MCVWSQEKIDYYKNNNMDLKEWISSFTFTISLKGKEKKRGRDKAYSKASFPTTCWDAFKIEKSPEILCWSFLDEV